MLLHHFARHGHQFRDVCWMAEIRDGIPVFAASSGFFGKDDAVDCGFQEAVRPVGEEVGDVNEDGREGVGGFVVGWEDGDGCPFVFGG